jgi:hypothetical protein
MGIGEEEEVGCRIFGCLGGGLERTVQRRGSLKQLGPLRSSQHSEHGNRGCYCITVQYSVQSYLFGVRIRRLGWYLVGT